MPQLSKVLIVGAGPAGLTAAYQLAKKGVSCTVLEKDPRYVGGISRSVRYRGFHFEIGGHRFFSKSETVNELWREWLPEHFPKVARTSRIYYAEKFFSYPLKPLEALGKLGLKAARECFISYVKSRIRPIAIEKSYEDWVVNRFGRRLFDLFFRHYTEKVWGLKCSEISADWAAQRINNLSPIAALFGRLLSWFRPGGIKSLVGAFHYPERGPGQLWEACCQKIRAAGGEVLLGATVESLEPLGDGKFRATYRREGETYEVIADDVISSAPLRELVAKLLPEPSAEVAEAAARLRYRDFITVNLILNRPPRFDDQWIYIHDPAVKVGRIANYRSWSSEMVPDEFSDAIRMEYFCFDDDGLWKKDDVALIELARGEIERLGLARAEWITDGLVIRQPKAYPVYDEGYAHAVDTIREELERRFPRLHLVGRNGMHKYNNQDHSMMTAMLVVENIILGTRQFDPWAVNQDAEYHEAVRANESGLRNVPARLIPAEA